MNVKMTTAHKELFRKNRFALVTSMMPDDILNNLVARKIVSTCQAEEITLPTKAKTQKCSTFTDIPQRRADSASFLFLK